MIDQDIQVNEFLEHVGVRGMKWGQRKNQAAIDRSTYKPQAKQPMSTKKKVAIAVGAAGLAVAGALIANKILKNNRNRKINEIESILDNLKNKSSSASKVKINTTNGKNAASKILNKNGVTPASILAKHAESKAKFDKFLAPRENALGYKYKGPTNAETVAKNLKNRNFVWNV